MDDTAIKIENITKSFKLPHERHNSIKSLFINVFRRKRSYEIQKALKDVSFEIKKGEFFGIVGRNGSGKSTLLKMIAGIYTPTKGDIKINGSLTPFIELGVGFNPELTGRENVFLNGALLGFNRKEMLAMYKDIVDFAELEKFMDQKLKNYSSGMQVRLAFSIAIRARSDILLLDEVLAVGDAAFQQKCLDYFVKLKKEKRTIVLVSHNMQTVEQFCDRVALIEGGKLKHIGESGEVAAMYEEMFMREEIDRLKKERSKDGESSEALVKILDVKVLQSGRAAENIKPKKEFQVAVTVQARQDFDKANVGINIKNRDRIMVVSTDTLDVIGDLPLLKNQKRTVVFNLENIFTNGVYFINVGIADTSGEIDKLLLRAENAEEFIISGIGAHYKSLVHPNITIELN